MKIGDKGMMKGRQSTCNSSVTAIAAACIKTHTPPLHTTANNTGNNTNDNSSQTRTGPNAIAVSGAVFPGSVVRSAARELGLISPCKP